jgi:hypothetical protein
MAEKANINSIIGQVWPDHPWVALNPKYKDRIYGLKQNCPYAEYTVIIDAADKYTKLAGEVAMDRKGVIRGKFWLKEPVG